MGYPDRVSKPRHQKADKTEVDLLTSYHNITRFASSMEKIYIEEDAGNLDLDSGEVSSLEALGGLGTVVVVLNG